MKSTSDIGDYDEMPLKTEPLEEPTINLTSMLDVVMLLIIFFMVGTKFSEEERQAGIQVPTVSDNVALSGRPDHIIVNVTVEGHISVRGESHTPVSLRSMLTGAREVFPDQGVLIRADGRCMHQAVMDVFSVCKEAGIKTLGVSLIPTTKGT